jgi:hypothetical protein
MVATTGELLMFIAANSGIFPVLEGNTPIEGLLLVQL